MAKHWHRCQRWTRRNLPCPLRHEEPEEDDDDDDDEDPVPVEEPIPIEPGIPLVERKARATADQEAAVSEAIAIVAQGVPQPVPQPTGGTGQFVDPPPLIKPLPVVPRTAPIPTGGTGFLPGEPVSSPGHLQPDILSQDDPNRSAPSLDAELAILLAAFTTAAFFFRTFGPGPVRLAAGAALLGMAQIEEAFVETMEIRAGTGDRPPELGGIGDPEGPDPLAGSGDPIAAPPDPPFSGRLFLTDMSQQFVPPQDTDIPNFTDR